MIPATTTLAMQKAMIHRRSALRAEQKAKQDAFRRGETRRLMGIGVSFFTEIVGAGPSKNCDILGVAMFDSAEIRIDPTGSVTPASARRARGRATRRPRPRSSQPSWSIPADDITVEEGNTDTAPYGLGTYGSRSTPVSGAATAMAARKIKAKAQMIAAHLLEVHDDDLEWDIDRFRVKGAPERFKTMKELAWAAYNSTPSGRREGSRGGQLLRSAEHDLSVRRLHLRRRRRCRHRRDEVSPVRRARRLRHAHQSDDHRGSDLRRTDRGLRHRHGPGVALRRAGNVLTASFMDYFLPTAVETPKWTTDWTTTPSPHHPIGAKGVGESPNVGGVPCFANAVNDAFAFLGSTHIPMPHDAWRTWEAACTAGAARSLRTAPGRCRVARR